MFAEPSLPLTGNICDRRLWRIKGASVGVAVDFVRRSKPHKQNRAPQEGKAVERSETEGVKIGYIKSCKNSPGHFFCEKTTAPSKMGRKHEPNLI